MIQINCLKLVFEIFFCKGEKNLLHKTKLLFYKIATHSLGRDKAWPSCLAKSQEII